MLFITLGEAPPANKAEVVLPALILPLACLRLLLCADQLMPSQRVLQVIKLTLDPCEFPAVTITLEESSPLAPPLFI